MHSTCGSKGKPIERWGRKASGLRADDCLRQRGCRPIALNPSAPPSVAPLQRSVRHRAALDRPRPVPQPRCCALPVPSQAWKVSILARQCSESGDFGVRASGSYPFREVSHVQFDLALLYIDSEFQKGSPLSGVTY
jgi:hypothetical protein